jgi:hypothetical protein
MEYPKGSPAADAKENSEKETLKCLHAIYLHTIAEKIKDGIDIKEGEFRKPIDTLAYKIASEYVANYLVSQIMVNSFEVVSKETDNYVRQRHDDAWIVKKLVLDETRNVFDQLMELCVSNKTTTATGTGTISGRKMKPKITRRGLGQEDGDVPDTLQSKTQTTSDVQFIESHDFSQFTGILTTNAGAEYNQVQSTVPVTENIFTELGTTTEIETTYDPRGVKAKPKSLPKITKNDLEHSVFRANDYTTMGTAIDTMVTDNDGMLTTESYLKPVPRNKLDTYDETWAELEKTQEETTLNLGVCPFKKDFEDIVARKKKMVSMATQATAKAPIEPNFAPAPPLNPIEYQDMEYSLSEQDEDENEA